MMNTTADGKRHNKNVIPVIPVMAAICMTGTKLDWVYARLPIVPSRDNKKNRYSKAT